MSDHSATHEPRWWEMIIIFPVFILMSFGIAVGLLIAPVRSGVKIGLEIFEEWSERKEAARAK